MRRFESEMPEPVDLLSGVLRRDDDGSGSLGTSGMVPASDTAMDEGLDEKRRKCEDRGRVGVGCAMDRVCSSGWVEARDKV